MGDLGVARFIGAHQAQPVAPQQWDLSIKKKKYRK
jgi:hypothetical protein